MKDEKLKEQASRALAINRNLHMLIHSRMSKKLSLGEMTTTQFYALSFLVEKEGVKMSELAQGLRVSRPAMTVAVDKLVQKKLVARRKEIGDRRIIKITITKKGEELVKRIRREIYELFLKIMQKLTPQEREEFTRIQEKLFSLLKDEDLSHD